MEVSFIDEDARQIQLQGHTLERREQNKWKPVTQASQGGGNKTTCSFNVYRGKENIKCLKEMVFHFPLHLVQSDGQATFSS